MKKIAIILIILFHSFHVNAQPKDSAKAPQPVLYNIEFDVLFYQRLMYALQNPSKTSSVEQEYLRDYIQNKTVPVGTKEIPNTAPKK